MYLATALNQVNKKLLLLIIFCFISKQQHAAKFKEISFSHSAFLEDVRRPKSRSYHGTARIFPYRNTLPFRTTIFQPIYVKKNSAGDFCHCIFLFGCIFISLSRKSDQCTARAHLGVSRHLSTTPRWGNLVKCLSQRHNK